MNVLFGRIQFYVASISIRISLSLSLSLILSIFFCVFHAWRVRALGLLCTKTFSFFLSCSWTAYSDTCERQSEMCSLFALKRPKNCNLAVTLTVKENERKVSEWANRIHPSICSFCLLSRFFELLIYPTIAAILAFSPLSLSLSLS